MSDQTIARPPALVRWRISAPARRALLTVHIVASVGLLGECAALLAVSLRAAGASDPATATSYYELMGMFSAVFGIPLSFTALLSGIALGFTTKWGVLRHWWVLAKLALILSVILVGALLIGPSEAAMTDGDGGRELVLTLGAGYDVLALGLATWLSVFKPRGRLKR